jgi:hypothetical protein
MGHSILVGSRPATLGHEKEYHLLLARDLKLIQPNDYEQLAEQTTKIKRMHGVCSEAEY